MSQVFKAMFRLGRERAGKVAAVALAGVVVTAIAPAAALARAEIQRGPTIAGTPQVGQTLRAEGAQWSGGDPSWYWLRCTGPNPTDRDCKAIPGANTTTYKVQSADRGLVLRVLLVVCESKRGECRSTAYAVSPQTAKVTDPPPPPPPPVKPTPTPPPTPPPTPTPPGPGPTGSPSPPATGSPAPLTPAPQPPATGGVLGETTRPALMMSPTPLVRIRGVMTSRGVRITLLTVRAPKGARITLSCRGRSCPAKRWANTAAVVRVMKFERSLRAGTRLTITVTKTGRIGKHTVIVIRRNGMPKRSDRCIYPGARKPVACPAS